MTYIVGWSPYHRDSAPVELAARMAQAEGETLRVVAVVSTSWSSIITRSSERAAQEEAAAEGERAARAARDLIEAAGVEGEAVWIRARSVPQALLSEVEEYDARLLVVGSGDDGPLGQITLTSKTDRLLHSSPVPVALAPRGFRASAPGGPLRLTCAFRDVETSEEPVVRSAELCLRVGAALRIATFGVYPRRMYPSEVGNAEQMVLDSWLRQTTQGQERMVARLAELGEEPPDTTTCTAVGWSWGDALGSVDWIDDELLVVGSSSTHRLAQVFLGSSASKIVRNSPVPVVVMP